LVIANAYFNDLIVPDSLMWKSNNPVIKTVELLIEAALFILCIYAINRETLGDTADKNNRNAIINRTVKIHIIITMIFIIAVRTSH
jgi:hypothetical protein